MTDIGRLGLGTMDMNLGNKQSSIKTIHAALDAGVTLFNTGEFYQGSESEMVTGEALKDVKRENFFLSVKFGVLPSPEGGIYGLDVKPFNVKGHLTYSLRRLGLDYIDLYQPARQDTTVPVEELVGAIAEQVKAGYVKHIGLSMVDAETLRRACKVHPIHTVEMNYSLINRDIEKELIAAAKELGVKVLAFGVLGHGMFSEKVLETGGFGRGRIPEESLSAVNAIKNIADEKGVSLSQLMIAWSLAKHENVQVLVGTTKPEHLLSAVEALKISLTKEDIEHMESASPKRLFAGRGMRNFVFTDGKMMRL
ncbi:MAG: aldo/keto reductase [Oscillospiraceae bacterium]|nr:aldo/keto reductase [Oscillospiraceae bacterium]